MSQKRRNPPMASLYPLRSSMMTATVEITRHSSMPKRTTQCMPSWGSHLLLDQRRCQWRSAMEKPTDRRSRQRMERLRRRRQQKEMKKRLQRKQRNRQRSKLQQMRRRDRRKMSCKSLRRKWLSSSDQKVNGILTYYCQGSGHTPQAHLPDCPSLSCLLDPLATADQEMCECPFVPLSTALLT
ncbi:SH3 domain-binding glutamic acid-rich protein isoform X7 [Periophthalmus magnuspinnatus]|uniref:SH3 domain-binding glutamic acid-rich protein isoform X7 n=1 Tax=Periophthalmus magnuspinnatus TaxID=409849 RepID=UPI0024364355|nr:SH3 domain-binding glutamic acid-rich protein isoform X7 [Periophthalmus magnuspinnatus]